jgi:hypothetical protein
MISKQQLILFLSILLFTQCKTSENTIRVRGRAYHSKAGACIVTKKEQIYYIKGLREWPKKYSEKKLVVTGKYTVVYDTSTTDNQERQRIRVKRDIDSAKYRVTIFGFIRKQLPEE